MPLIHFLFRCPRCGHDPLPGRGDEARCPSCGTGFARGRGGGAIEVREASGEALQVPSHLLAAAVRRWEEEDAERRGGDEGRRAGVRMRRAVREEPVRYRGRVLGFAESLGADVPGTLELAGKVIVFEPSPLGVEERDPPAGGRWPLGEIRAVQTTSSALQIAPREGGVVQFKFEEDSPQRWELLLHRALRAHYREAGKGEIVEFQPRIRTE